MSDADETAAAGLRTAFDLFVAGRHMMRQNLKRRHPEASDQEIDRLLRAWLRERPGAEHGDAAGRSIQWPRKGPSRSVRPGRKRSNGLARLSGTWTKAELAQFEAATGVTGEIDEELWP